jgi:hypothetical protein
MQLWELGSFALNQSLRCLLVEEVADLFFPSPRSMWVFLLLGMEAIRTYRSNPYLVIATYHIPTWTTPLVMILFVAALVPSTSLLGHLCGVGVGYLCEKFLP